MNQEHKQDHNNYLQFLEAQNPGIVALSAINEEDLLITADAESEKHENEKRRLENINYKQNIALRKEYANKVFVLVAFWLFIILLIIFLQATNGWYFQLWHKPALVLSSKFSLPESVLNSLLVSTSISVISLFVLVLNFIFPKEQEPA